MRWPMRGGTGQRIAVAVLALAAWISTGHEARAQTPPSAAEVAAYSGLHKAAHDGDAAAIRQLLADGADPEARDGNGRTAAHVSAFASHEEAVTTLAAGGADVNALDADAYDMVTIAAVANDLAMLKAAHGGGYIPAYAGRMDPTTRAPTAARTSPRRRAPISVNSISTQLSSNPTSWPS